MQGINGKIYRITTPGTLQRSLINTHETERKPMLTSYHFGLIDNLLNLRLRIFTINNNHFY